MAGVEVKMPPAHVTFKEALPPHPLSGKEVLARLLEVNRETANSRKGG